MRDLIDVITSGESSVRNLPLEAFCADRSAGALLAACAELDDFRRRQTNLYERVRALFFLSAIYRYHLPGKLPPGAHTRLPYEGHLHLLHRRFDEAIESFLGILRAEGPSETISSALAAAYYQLGFQTLAGQVRHSVRSVKGNQWMFRVGHPADHPLRLRGELLARRSPHDGFPILCESTPVRMDLSHSGWSDIFFLGMDFPEGARVLNISVDLGVRGRDARPRPPIEVYLRAIDEPVLRLVSVDLKCMASLEHLREVFDFGKDYLGLLKAAVIAAGIVPPGLEGSEQNLTHVLAQIVGPGLGLEIVSKVNDIPKGSRLAVSTNLLASIISVAMRATGQIKSLTGTLSEAERRIVAARAILGEWLGGSGGGWQDSGGVWPGIKMIQGCRAEPGDPEHGISRGRLLPAHRVYDANEVSPAARQSLCDSVVLVHGGMAQDVGPILEMVTERYLLRSAAEWQARLEAIELCGRIEASLQSADIKALADATTRNFVGPIQRIIPWASNHYTETLIDRTRARFGTAFWGFLMLGGMSGGGMGFLFEPRVKATAEEFLAEMMCATKAELEHALPFAMEPVIYHFAINSQGTQARLLSGDRGLLPPGYYAMVAPQWLRRDMRQASPGLRADVERFAAASHGGGELAAWTGAIFESLFPKPLARDEGRCELQRLLEENGFDPELHEQIRADLCSGRIGLAQNRLPIATMVEDARPEDMVSALESPGTEVERMGAAALERGAVAVVTLAAGAGSRWTHGAGTVKALHPFHRFAGRFRTFLDVHLAKSRRTARQYGMPVPHVITTSYLTHRPIEQFLDARTDVAADVPVYLSRGRSVGLRMIPMERDLRFAWEETPHQLLDEQAEKVRESVWAAMIAWATSMRPGSDYTDNVPAQCLHPVGHWFEVANLLRNGTLRRLLDQRPQLAYLLLHNLDTLGADLDPGVLGLHVASGACLTFEVIGRRIEDRGGGLARINGQLRLVESLALPREEDEFKLTYYNTMTTWISVDRLLEVFELSRDELADEEKVTQAVRALSLRMPTYVTLKDVKKRWGYGQEDVYPVAQFEKLWSDMTAFPKVEAQFLTVPRMRGQQLKEQAQLDSWLRDGSAGCVERLCAWE